MEPFVVGPTYAEMRNPLRLPAPLRQAVLSARSEERNPLTLTGSRPVLRSMRCFCPNN